MQKSTFRGRVTDEHGRPIRNAAVHIQGQESFTETRAGQDGAFELTLEHGELPKKHAHQLVCTAFGKKETRSIQASDAQAAQKVHFQIALGFRLSCHAYTAEGEQLIQADRLVANRRMLVRAETNVDDHIARYEWELPDQEQGTALGHEVDTVPSRAGVLVFKVTIVETSGADTQASVTLIAELHSVASNAQAVAGEVGVRGNVGVHGEMGVRGNIGVTLQRTATFETRDQAFWVAIRNRTHAVSFNRYTKYMHRVLYGSERPPELDVPRGVNAYHALKYATEAFLLHEAGIFDPQGGLGPFDPIEEGTRLNARYTAEQMDQRLREYLGEPPGLLPYIRNIVQDAFPWLDREDATRNPALMQRLDRPLLIELFHTYWLEEGMVMQSINAVAQRFQNVRSVGDRDPLANFEVDPLRQINNWLWGYIQDEVNRLTVRRRAFEYMHQYGLTLYGKAAPGLRAADQRSKFLEAFHNLLYQSSVFFKEDFQTTIIADGYPLLNSLKEVHLILAQGAHNQFGDLPWTARVETLLAQFILAQPAIRSFLQSRAMVPYQEDWMPQVDAMKTLQGWSDVTVTHFRNLAVYGEQILLSVRYGNWIMVNDEDSARNWARYWRPEIQGYLHAYRAATGVDLTNSDKVDSTIPAVHLQNRLSAQQHRAR